MKASMASPLLPTLILSKTQVMSHHLEDSWALVASHPCLKVASSVKPTLHVDLKQLRTVSMKSHY